MKTMKAITLAILLFMLNGQTYAQQLTENQKAELRARVKQKVEEFEHSLSCIVNRELSSNIRNENVKLLLGLFLGEGDPYDYFDSELGRDVHSTGVKMQTSSVYRTNTQTQKLKRYIYRLYDPTTGRSSLNYSKITIESANAVRVDNIERVDDHYECMAYFCQKFIGYRDGRVVYSDETTKKVRCEIRHMAIPGEESGGWDAKLGDIYVISTKKL